MPSKDRPNTNRSEQREVTLLFADLRGFTELAAVLETDPLFCELLAHVMDCLTAAVMNFGGYVVDYYGDGLVAMWNAPSHQPDHADRAVSAGFEMLATLPAVADEWRNITQTDLRLGIGVHTGSVQIGNAGSTQQAKYGPRGPNVHLASRVETATKEIGLPLLATRVTIEQLSNAFAANRVCRAQMPGLGQPVDLYSVTPASDNLSGRGRACDAPEGDSLARAWQRYENALCHFEHGRYDRAAAILDEIDLIPSGVPIHFLLDQVQRALGARHGRRSTDKPAAIAGVVALTVK
jgi:adenylate cyclase